MEWSACVPQWPLPESEPTATDEQSNGSHTEDEVKSPNGVEPVSGEPPPLQSTNGGWRVYTQPAALDATYEAAAAVAVTGTEAEAAAAATAASVHDAAVRGPRNMQWAVAVDLFHDEIQGVNKLIDSYAIKAQAERLRTV